MADLLPHINAAVIVLRDGTRVPMTGEYYHALRRVLDSLGGQVTDLQQQQEIITAVLSALGVDDLAGLEALDLSGLQKHSDNLDAIGRLYGSGLAVQVSLFEWATRTLTGTTDRITVTNGDGTSGNPTIDLATLADAGGGTLRKFVRDAWGRISGSSIAVLADIPAPTGTGFSRVTAGAWDAASVGETGTGSVMRAVAPTASDITSTTWAKVGSYTVAGVPSAATAGAGAMIYVSNEVGGAVIAFSDGAAWRRATDRAIIA